MYQALTELGIFTAEAIIITLLILFILLSFFMLLAKAKGEKAKGKLVIKNLNEKYNEIREELLSNTLSKKQFKQFLKNKKAEDKAKQEKYETAKNIFVLTFHGDMKASAVSSLSEEITAVLNIATPRDEVMLRLESGGGVVHGYGLAAAQLMRIRAQNIPLVISIDKIAASGGYMMACIANKILSAPFAIIGSIGIVVQLPNFNRFLKNKQIDFELHTAGEYKRTLTIFGENTEQGREKLQDEIEDIHAQFKHLVKEYRKEIDIEKVATGEYWLGQEAMTLNLVDEIRTSDDYLLEKSKTAHLFEICYEFKKPLLSKLSGTASILREKLFGMSML